MLSIVVSLDMALNIAPDNVPSHDELVLEMLRTLLEKVDRMDRVLSQYEPIMAEAARRMSGPLSFGRRKESK